MKTGIFKKSRKHSGEPVILATVAVDNRVLPVSLASDSDVYSYTTHALARSCTHVLTAFVRFQFAAVDRLYYGTHAKIRRQLSR